jgi:adenine-specific DNA-methyltransferase
MPELNWIGKDAVRAHHRDVPFHLLKDVPELGCGSGQGDSDGNLIVQGDNLLALKALLPRYAGQVKCIYIDPPYNTGNEGWVYNDNVKAPEIQRWLNKVVGKEAEDLSRHDKWLCMMYPRLQLLKRFLREDGVIIVSIDDFEAHRLRMVLEEVFGAPNFIAQLVWEKGRKNDAKLFSVGHEYMLVYAKSKSTLGEVRWRAPKQGITEIISEFTRLRQIHGDCFELISSGLKSFYKSLPADHPAKKYARACNADLRGVWRDNNISWPGGGGPKYDIIHPKTGLPCKVPDDGWRFVESTMQEKIRDGWVVFREDHKKSPFLKSYIYMVDGEEDEETNDGKTEVLGSYFYRHSQPANDVLKELFGEKVFENPKDHEILARLIRYVTNNDRECLILDSFGGSGTTAHAVLQLFGGQRESSLCPGGDGRENSEFNYGGASAARHSSAI